jgi:hypothetical protein
MPRIGWLLYFRIWVHNTEPSIYKTTHRPSVSVLKDGLGKHQAVSVGFAHVFQYSLAVKILRESAPGQHVIILLFIIAFCFLQVFKRLP